MVSACKVLLASPVKISLDFSACGERPSYTFDDLIYANLLLNMQRGENIGISARTASQIRETSLTWMVPFIEVVICSFSRVHGGTTNQL